MKYNCHSRAKKEIDTKLSRLTVCNFHTSKRSKYVFLWLRFWMGSPDDVLAVCNYAMRCCFSVSQATVGGHSKIISLNVTSSISKFLGKMLTLLASVMKKCIRQRKDTAAHLVFTKANFSIHTLMQRYDRVVWNKKPWTYQKWDKTYSFLVWN